MKESENKLFNGRIRLYALDGNKSYIVEVQSAIARATFEALHGMQFLEGLPAYQDDPHFNAIYEELWFKCEVYADKLKQLRRFKRTNWDWDWVYTESKGE